jgi:hypothetical protein
MSGIQIHYQDSPITSFVSAVVVGGQFVDADQPNSITNVQDTVKPSVAGSLLAVGVALSDAAPPGTDPTNTTVQRPAYVAVARRGACVPVTFAAASTFGDRLKTAAAGAVTPWIDGTDDVAKIVGTNVDPAGAVASAAVGLVSISVG